MLTGGEALEDYAENRAKTELSDLLKRKPKKTHLIKGTKTVDILVKDVQVGDKLKILLGEVVPVDCIVLEGQSVFDESSLTGESMPVEKTEGEQLLSGSVNTGAVVTVRALRTADDSQYEQIIKLVKAAASSQSPFVRMADRYAVPFTAVAFIIAGAAWIVSGDVGRFLEVLVVATPCPLLLGAPIALISGMSRSAKHGIIVKNGSTLEKLAEVETVAFDKTGTLTQGQPSVHSITDIQLFHEKRSAHFCCSAGAKLQPRTCECHN
jgi:P-type E1-E2 ATPase